MDSAPGIPTTNNTGYAESPYNPTSDPYSARLNQLLNAMDTQIPTQQFYQRSTILQYPDVGVYPESSMYDVGYHHVPVAQEVKIESHYEAPETPVNNKPYNQALYDSTRKVEQGGGQPIYNYRAPAINEGL